MLLISFDNTVLMCVSSFVDCQLFSARDWPSCVIKNLHMCSNQTTRVALLPLFLAVQAIASLARCPSFEKDSHGYQSSRIVDKYSEKNQSHPLRRTIAREGELWFLPHLPTCIFGQTIPFTPVSYAYIDVGPSYSTLLLQGYTYRPFNTSLLT